ncbi:MAG: hypothetical protein KQI35_11545 [Bacteroidetes bacterium]|nr:hypothetical protein [Bacteroidota bacterium]
MKRQKGNVCNSNVNALIAVVIILLLAFSGCIKKTYEKVESTWPDGTPQWVQYYRTEAMKEVIREARFYESGAKRIAGPIKDGERHGKWEAWYEDGTLWSVGTFENGVENGTKTVYYENGNKYYEGYIKNDERVGTWKFWDEDGNLVKEVNYDQ